MKRGITESNPIKLRQAFTDYVGHCVHSPACGKSRRKVTRRKLVADTTRYPKKYYRRENSESGFAVDKKLFGWSIAQKREDRIGCAKFSIGLWHNLFNLGTQ